MSLRSPFVPWLFAFALAACSGSRETASRTSKGNFAYLYGPEASSLDFQVRVYHATEESSDIFFKLRTRDLLYKSSGGGTSYVAKVRVLYESFSDWRDRTLLDSASTIIQDVSDRVGLDKELIGSMPMRRGDRPSFVMRITAFDLHRGTQSSVVIDVDRRPTSLRQNFLPLETMRDLPYFDDHFSSMEVVRVRCEQLAGSTLQVDHHAQEFRLPSPVFALQPHPTVDTSADSSFQVTVDEAGHFLLPIGKLGIYHVRSDTTRTEGYTVFRFADGYPAVLKGDHLLEPMRYITSMQEYDRMSSAGDRRAAVERFWLDAAGSKDRARSAIRTYFERVENANRYFTSYVEGWRTDRGLVHIIFGSPNTIYRAPDTETWIYGEENNMMSLTFRFSKRDIPFTNNDLVLDRDPTFKGAWYRNVESWRNGRVLQN